MAETSAVVKLNELIKDSEFVMLTTIRTNGSLHSCPMASQPADADGVIWFLSDTNTEKVEAIRTDHRVNLAYSDAGRGRYVSIGGRCELVRDHVKAKELWKPLYETWFPKGAEDPDLILLKVHVQEAEYWEATMGHMVRIRGLL
jgi:general stress protein 26